MNCSGVMTRWWGVAANGAQVPLYWTGSEWTYWDIWTQRFERWVWG